MTKFKKLKTKLFCGICLEIFLKMLIGSPGPGQAAGTVWRPKILQNPKKNIFIYSGHFPESSMPKLDKNDPGKSPLFVKIFFR